jgi:hypothetical protein
MRRQIDQTEDVAVPARNRDVPVEVLRQGIGQRDCAVSSEARQHLAGECLGDGADAHQRLAVRLTAGAVSNFAEAGNRRVRAAHGSNNQARHPGLDVQHLAEKLGRLLQQRILGARRLGECYHRQQQRSEECSRRRPGSPFANERHLSSPRA